MNNLSILEENFKKFYKNISSAPSESLIQVDLNLLHHLGLLHYHSRPYEEPSLTRYFQVVETFEKITLINEDFVIWIVPEQKGEISLTYTLIALNHEEGPHLELTFITSGVYNTSRLVLRVLEKFLLDIQENEDLLKKMNIKNSH